MTVEYDRQYRAISQLEAGSAGNGFPASVRLRELAWSINNFKARVSPCIMIPCQRFWSAHLAALEGSTSEQVIHMFAPVFVPHGYGIFHWTIGAYLISGGSTRWRLYSSPYKYNGNQTFDPTFFGASATNSEIWVSSTSHSFLTATDGIVSKDMTSAQTWLTLTAQNTSGSVGNYCIVKSLSAAAYVRS